MLRPLPYLTLSPLPEVLNGQKQEEHSEDSDVGSDVDCDVDKDVEEEKSSDIEEEEKSIPKEVEDWRPRAREVGEELQRRLAEPGGSPPVCKTLYAFVGREADELSFEPASIITITEVRPSSMWMIGTLEGKEGHLLLSYVVILD